MPKAKKVSETKTRKIIKVHPKEHFRVIDKKPKKKKSIWDL